MFSKRARIFNLLSRLLQAPKDLPYKEDGAQIGLKKRDRQHQISPVQPRHDAIITAWHDHLEGRAKAQFPTSIQFLASVSRLPNLTITLLVLSTLGVQYGHLPTKNWALTSLILCVLRHALNLSLVIWIEKS